MIPLFNDFLIKMSKTRRKVNNSKGKQLSTSPSPKKDLFFKGQGLFVENSSSYTLAIVKEDSKPSSHHILVTILKEAGNELEYTSHKESKITPEQILLRLTITKHGKIFKITEKENQQIQKIFNSKSSKNSEPLTVGKRKNPENKTKSQKPSKRTKTPTKYKKGKINPLVSTIDSDPFLDYPENKPKFGDSIRMNNLNFFRAAVTGNEELVKKLLKSDQKISNILQAWGPEDRRNCLEVALLNEHGSIVKMIMEELKEPKMKKTFIQPSALQVVGTGSVSVEAYGVKTRAVQMSRGGREGNNALLCDSSYPDDPRVLVNLDFLKTLVRKGISPKMLNLLISLFPLIENPLYLCIGESIRTGNIELSRFLIKKALEKNGFGFNFLHEEVLKPDPLSQFKKVSITKKPIENYCVAPLHAACINPDTTHLADLIANTDDFNYPDMENRKLVHYAAACISVAPLKYLESLNINFSEADRQKVTPLMIAASLGRVQNVEFLLSKNVPVNFKSRSGKCAIHFAAESGQVEVLQILLKNGATIDFPGTDRKTPLMFAATFGHYPAVSLLLDSGAKNTKKDKCKRTALIWAVKNGHSQVVSLLLSKGSPHNDADSSKNHAVHYAAAYGWVDCLSLLVQAGADINACNDWKLQPLLISMLKGQSACVSYLLSQSHIEVNGKDENGRTLVSQSIEMLTEESLKQLEFLLKDKQADCNVVDTQGFSPLHHLCSRGKPVCANWEWNDLAKLNWNEQAWDLQVKAAKLLIEFGCDLNGMSREGLPPIVYAMKFDNTRLVNLLIEFKADLAFRSQVSGGVFHCLAFFKPQNFEILDRMMEDETVCSNAINLVDEKGFTPLLKFVFNFDSGIEKRMEEVRKEKEEVMKKEMEKGVRNVKGQTQGIENFNLSNSPMHLAHSQTFDSFISTNLSLQLNYPLLESQVQDQISSEVHQFLHLVKKMIKKGADPSSTVQKELKYRQNPDLIHSEPSLTATTNFFSININQKENFILDFDNTKRYKEYSPEGLQNLLHMVSSCKYESLVSLILSQKLNINQRDFYGDTPLMLFVKSNSKFLNKLIEKGADVNIRNCENELAIQKAIENKSIESVNLLIKAKSDLNTQVSKGKTPLNVAVQLKDLEIVRALLENGADPNYKDAKLRNSLHVAFNFSDSSANASFDVESLLLLFKADINAVDCRNRCPLHYSFVKIGNYLDMAQIDPIESVSSACALQEIQLDIQDQWKKTPLHYAAQRGALTSSMFMLNKGADLEIEDIDGNTPLAISIKEGHANYSVMLVQQKANVNKTIRVNPPKPPPTTIDQSIPTKVPAFKSAYRKLYIEAKAEVPTKLKEGDYSMFHASIIQNFQGLAYLLIFNGYPYMLAMQDAMSQNKFQLVKTLLAKVSDSRQLQQVNSKKQNLFHTLAIFGGKAGQTYTQSISTQLKDRHVQMDALDEDSRSPLHHACKAEFTELIKILLEAGVSHKHSDKFGLRPLAYAIEGKKILKCLPILQIFVDHKAELRIKVKSGQVELTPLLHAIAQQAPANVIKFFMDHGASVTEKDSVGRNSLMYAVMNNDLDLAVALLNERKISIKETDNEGKNVLHYVVQPLEYGSYENVDLLKLILKDPKINPELPDCRGQSAIYLASLQRSNRLLKVFEASGFKVPGKVTRKNSDYLPGSVEHDFVSDSHEFVKLQKGLKKTEEVKRSPDPAGEFPAYYQVVDDFDLLMTKVDLSHGPYSAYVFYRMQLLEDTNRNVYVLFTRWGRIGETGAFQRTPFADRDEAVKEFCKIYKNKSGNDWGEMFEKKKGKYVPMKLNFTQTRCTDFIKEFDEEKSPAARLCKETQEVLKLCTSQTMYRSYFSHYSVDVNVLNFSNISKQSIEKAESLLLEISALAKEMIKETDVDLKIQKIQEIQDLSSRYYELIPVIHENNSAIPPIISDQDIKKNIEKINLLRNMELVSKLILGALYCQNKINPYDYISNSIATNLDLVDRDSGEFKLIEKYVNITQEHGLISLHKVCRKGEVARIRNFDHEKRRKLLWHGTSSANILGIMVQGLKIAPPEVPNSGYMFGKGIYLADCFEKSLGYCFDYFSDQDSAFLLLCEVVLGEMLVKTQAEFIEKLPNGYLSTLGQGKSYPDPKGSVFTPYGAEVPVGNLLSRNDPKVTLSYNEFIVYDVSQVRIRYLVRVKSNNY